MFVKLSTLLTLGNNTLLFVFRFAAYYLNWTLFWWYKIERKSINALRACVYIYIRQLSLFRGLSIWLSLLAIFQYTFLSLFQEKTDNTLKEVFSINALCAPNGHLCNKDNYSPKLIKQDLFNNSVLPSGGAIHCFKASCSWQSAARSFTQRNQKLAFVSG